MIVWDGAFTWWDTREFRQDHRGGNGRLMTDSVGARQTTHTQTDSRTEDNVARLWGEAWYREQVWACFTDAGVRVE